MEREIRRLRQALAQRPLKPPKGGSSVLYTIVIDRGNTLSDGSTLGIKWAAVAPTTVPSLYNATTDTSFVDGIGRGTLYQNATSLGLVLVANYTGNGSPLTLALRAGQTVATTASTLSLPLVSDATQSVTLYIPYPP